MLYSASVLCMISFYLLVNFIVFNIIASSWSRSCSGYYFCLLFWPLFKSCEYLGVLGVLFTANTSLVRLCLCQAGELFNMAESCALLSSIDNITQVGCTFDTMAAVIPINISVGMRLHAHIQQLWRVTQRLEDKGTTFQETLLCAHAGICHCLVRCDVPTSLLWVYCSEPLAYTMLGKKKWQTFVKYSFHKAAIVEWS